MRLDKNHLLSRSVFVGCLVNPRDPNTKKTKKVGSWCVFKSLNTFSEGIWIPREKQNLGAVAD